MRGFFITFEGGEGTGKTTQLTALLAYLRADGFRVVQTRDPGGTVIGNQIRELLLSRENVTMTPLAELMLYEASRAQLVAEVIQPALGAGQVVLCDRFTDSTVAYQGYGRGLDPQVIAHLNAVAAAGLQPDLTFLLDLDPVVGLRRVAQRAPGAHERCDRLEAEVLEFHQRVRAGYRALAAREPGRIVLLDAAQAPQEIEGHIRRRVAERVCAGTRSPMGGP